MPMIPVDTAVQIMVGPLVDDTDFKSRETGIAYNAAGMDIDLLKSSDTGTPSTTAITLTSGGANDWVELSGGYYYIEITAAQNNVEGKLKLIGILTGVLPFESIEYDVVPQEIYNLMVAGSTAIGNLVWDADKTNHQVASSFGLHLQDITVTGIATQVDTTLSATHGAGAWTTGAGSAITVSEITSGVWDALETSHVVAGSFGEQLQNTVTDSSVADAVWDEVLTGATHNIADSAGKRLRQQASVIIHDGTAQGPAVNGNQIELAGTASAVDGSYDPSMIVIIEGTGAGQSRLILEYDGATQIATVDRAWKVNPDGTSEYIILGHPGREHVNEGLIASGISNGAYLNSLASSDNNAYIDQTLFIRSGTGEDQARHIIAYNGSTKLATSDRAWATIPDSTSAYVILPHVIMDHDHTGATITGVDTLLTAQHGAGAWTTAAGVSVNVGEIVTGVWNAATTNYATAGSFGLATQDLTVTGIATQVDSTLTTAHGSGAWTTATTATVDVGEIVTGVWNAIGTDYNTVGSMGGLQNAASGMFHVYESVPG